MSVINNDVVQSSNNNLFPADKYAPVKLISDKSVDLAVKSIMSKLEIKENSQRIQRTISGLDSLEVQKYRDDSSLPAKEYKFLLIIPIIGWIAYAILWKVCSDQVDEFNAKLNKDTSEETYKEILANAHPAIAGRYHLEYAHLLSGKNTKEGHEASLDHLEKAEWEMGEKSFEFWYLKAKALKNCNENYQTVHETYRKAYYLLDNLNNGRPSLEVVNEISKNLQFNDCTKDKTAKLVLDIEEEKSSSIKIFRDKPVKSKRPLSSEPKPYKPRKMFTWG